MGDILKYKGMSNLRETQEALKSLPAKENARIWTNVIRKATNSIIVPELKSISRYSSKTKAQFVSQGNVNEIASYTGPTSEVYPTRFVEKGTKLRKTKKGYSRGAITAKNEMSDIYDKDAMPVVDRIVDEGGNEVVKMIKRKVKRIK